MNLRIGYGYGADDFPSWCGGLNVFQAATRNNTGMIPRPGGDPRRSVSIGDLRLSAPVRRLSALGLFTPVRRLAALAHGLPAPVRGLPVFLLGLSALALGPLAPAGHALELYPEEGRTVIHLATGSVGGTFLPVGHELARWFESQVPGLTVVVDTTAGSVDNLGRLVDEQADIAIVGSSPLRKILEERYRMALAREARDICLVGTLYNDAEQYVIRASMIRAESMLDLSGVHMYPGPHKSGGEVDTRTVLETIGVEPDYVYPLDRDKGYAEAAEALAAGEFDACTFSGGVPISAVTELLSAHPGEFRIVPFSRHQLNKVAHAHLDFEPVVIPAGSYPGQDEDITSVGGPNLLVAGPRLPHELIAALDAAVRKGIERRGEGLRVAASHPVLQSLTVAVWDRPVLDATCLATDRSLAGARGAKTP